MVSIKRLQGLFLRHLYPLKRDFDLLSDMAYWPLIDTVLWGVTSQWLGEASTVVNIVASILLALILWNVIWRSQSEVARNLLDEIWNDNLVNLFSTPLKIGEWVIGVTSLSFIKTAITMAIIIPAVMILYSVNVLQLGAWLPVYYLSAMLTGWWVGFISAGIVLRHGPKVQTVVWTLPGFLLPFSAIYFPVDRLPAFLQPISKMLPSTYIFESLRMYLQTGSTEIWFMVVSFGLNFLYLGLAVWFFMRSFKYSVNLGLNRFH